MTKWEAPGLGSAIVSDSVSRYVPFAKLPSERTAVGRTCAGRLHSRSKTELPHAIQVVLSCFAGTATAGKIGPTPDGDANTPQVGVISDECLIDIAELRPRGDRQASDVVFARAKARILKIQPEWSVFANEEIAEVRVSVQRDPMAGRSIGFAAKTAILRLEEFSILSAKLGTCFAVGKHRPTMVESSGVCRETVAVIQQGTMNGVQRSGCYCGILFLSRPPMIYIRP